jgi:hypothetical protein
MHMLIYFEYSVLHPWVHSSVARAADCRSAGPWFKSGCALFTQLQMLCDTLTVGEQNPVTRNRTRDHLMAARVYSQMLYQLSYDRLTAPSPGFVCMHVMCVPSPVDALSSVGLCCCRWCDWHVSRRCVHGEGGTGCSHQVSICIALETGLEPAISSLGGRRLIH